MLTKTFQVGFFQQMVVEGQKVFVSDLLKKEYKSQKKGKTPYTWMLNNYAFQLRDIVSINKGLSFTGILIPWGFIPRPLGRNIFMIRYLSIII